MQRKTAHDFDQELLILFDAFVHGAIDRRAFLDKTAKFAVGGVTAAMLLDQLSPNFLAAVVKTDDPRIKAEHVEFDSPKGYGKGHGYLVCPAKTKGKVPGILVIHENRGLNPHIEDIVRRLALVNFIAFAPDALFPLGGYPGDEDKARELFQTLDQAKTREDFVAAARFLGKRPKVKGKIGAVGFCYGGGMVNYLATRLGDDLGVGVAFYGSAPNLEDVPKIKAPLMIQSPALSWQGCLPSPRQPSCLGALPSENSLERVVFPLGFRSSFVEALRGSPKGRKPMPVRSPARRSVRALRALPGCAALVILCACLPAAAAPSLVKDINTVVSEPPSNPNLLTNVNGTTMYFLGEDESHGRELWKSDGTSSGTVLVKDINPGASDSNAQSFVNVNGTVFFSADDGVRGHELWKTDGTAEGTVLVKDIRPQQGTYFSSDPVELVSVNGTLFFTADDSVNGREVWKSDGTSAGTVLVKDVYPGSTTSNATYLIELNGALLFFARDSATPLNLWKSDGTTAGTVLLKTITPTAGGPNRPVRVGSRVFFGVHSGSGLSDLWKSDGTTAGTVIVKNFVRGAFEPGPLHLTDVNGILYFSSASGTTGIELWKSDGTAAGTVLVKDINTTSANASGAPEALTNVNGVLYFSATNGTSGLELWKSDGTAAGTVMIKDIWAGGANSLYTALGYSPFPNVNGTVFFLAHDGTHGHELWKSDGTAAGTVLIEDLYPGPLGSLPGYVSYPIEVNGTVYLAVQDAPDGTHAALWRSNGTADNTFPVKEDPTGSDDSSPSGLVLLNGSGIFAADDGIEGNELWKSDGTDAGTEMVKDIRPGTDGSSPSLLTDVNGTVFFAADDGTNGQELWRSDGTEVGTALIKDINPGAAGSDLAEPTQVGATLFFSADGGSSGTELWKSDGTAAGTTIVRDIATGDSAPAQLTNVNGTLFFAATVSSTGRELWKSDGTFSGTLLVLDINPGSDSSSPSSLTNMNGVLFFAADHPPERQELWKSDGTAAGTVLVKDVNPGGATAKPTDLTVVGGALFFVATTSNGRELWKSDGTTAGTVLVKDINPGTPSSAPSSLTDVNGTLFFMAITGANGRELWKSDGTAAGTVLVKDINPGSAHSTPSELVAVNGRLFFRADDGINGFELWQSDGTTAGTFIVYDINPASSDSSPAEITPLASSCSSILFSAEEPVAGREIWSLPVSFAPGVVGGLSVAKNLPTPGAIQVSWTSLDPVAGPETTYDVARGVLSILHASGFPGGAVCASSDLQDTPYDEPAAACAGAPGDGCWYLVRAQNGCGTGSYGASGLDSSSPCP